MERSQRFGVTLDEETLNENHQIVIVASSMDASTERIVGYLSDKKVSINVLCFQVFSHGNDQLLSRSWRCGTDEITPICAVVLVHWGVVSSVPHLPSHLPWFIGGLFRLSRISHRLSRISQICHPAKPDEEGTITAGVSRRVASSCSSSKRPRSECPMSVG